MANPIKIKDFTGGLNSGEPTTIGDNQLSIAKNIYYDNQKNLSVRKGTTSLGNDLVSATSVHSTYYTKFTDGTRILLAGAGTRVYKYNETTTNWDVIKTGMTDGLKLSLLTYKDKIYWTNGTDNFMSYDGTTVNEHAASIKPKYMVVQNDIIYTGGVTTDPSTLFYTDANPADVAVALEVANVNSEPVNQDEGIITGVSVLGSIVAVGKTKGVYMVNVFATPVDIQPLDFDGDCSGHRGFVNAENDLLFMSNKGIYSVAQRQGTTGSFRATSFSEDIQKNIDLVEDKTSVAAHYFKKTNNIYLAVNSGEGTQNDKMFVYSVLTSVPGQKKFVWTEYENINANDFCEYEDENGDIFLLVADAFNPSVKKMETGYADVLSTGESLEIQSKIQTKTFDFGSPELWKTFPYVDVGGLISTNETVRFYADIDGTETSKTFTGEDYGIGDDANDNALGEEDLGEDVLGGGEVSVDGVTYYPFLKRRTLYQSGQRIRIRLESDSLNSGFKLTKLNIPVEIHGTNVLPNNYLTT